MENLKIGNQPSKEAKDSERHFATLNNQHNKLHYFYRNHAHIYDTSRSSILDSFDDKIELLKTLVNISNKSKVVEIGVGTGEYLSKIVEDARCKGIGVDICREMLKIADSKKVNNITYIHSDGTKLPLKSGCFDIVFMVNSIHQISDLHSIFSESSRILKVKGKFIVFTPEINRLKVFMLYKACPFLFEFEKNRMPTKELLAQRGLKVGYKITNHIMSLSNNTITLEQFLACIKNRFLSCLALLNGSELKEVLLKVKTFALENCIYQVKPYTHMVVVFEKQEEEG